MNQFNSNSIYTSNIMNSNNRKLLRIISSSFFILLTIIIYLFYNSHLYHQIINKFTIIRQRLQAIWDIEVLYS